MSRRLYHRFLFVVALLSVSWPATAQERGRQAATPAKILTEVHLDRDSERPVIPVVIDGVHYPFVVDTGAATSCFDPALRTHLGERINRTVEKSDDGRWTHTVDEFAAPCAFVGRCLLLDSGSVECRDLAPFRQLDGGSYMGVAGVDFLKRYVVRIDFDAGKLQLLSQVPAQAGERFSINIDDDDHSVLAANVADHEQDFILDTGSDSSISLRQDLFLKLVAEGSISVERDSWVCGVDGPRPSVSGRLSSLRIGPFEHRDLVVSMDSYNLLGSRYLSRYAFILDLKSRTFFLKPGKVFDRPDRRDLSGMAVVQEGKRFMIDHVVPFGPAVRAGLEPDDVIVGIDGRDPSELSLRGMRRFFEQEEGKSVRLTVRRNGRSVQATVALREYTPERLRASKALRLDTRAE